MRCKKTINLFILLMLAGCSHAPEKSCQNAMGVHYNIPIKITFHTSYKPEYIPVFKQAAQTWSAAARRDLFIFDDKTDYGPELARQDGVNLIFIPGMWEYESNKQAITRNVILKTQVIADSDLIINPNYNYYLGSGVPASNQISLQSLMLHEIGHMLGLDHRLGSSVMYPYLSYGQERNQLDSIDVADIRCLYGRGGGQ